MKRIVYAESKISSSKNEDEFNELGYAAKFEQFDD